MLDGISSVLSFYVARVLQTGLLTMLSHRQKRCFATEQLPGRWLSDFGGFPVTSGSMTVKSKCVLHTKPVVFASIESVLSEK